MPLPALVEELTRDALHSWRGHKILPVQPFEIRIHQFEEARLLRTTHWSERRYDEFRVFELHQMMQLYSRLLLTCGFAIQHRVATGLDFVGVRHTLGIWRRRGRFEVDDRAPLHEIQDSDQYRQPVSA